jgi:hypothetical protein
MSKNGRAIFAFVAAAVAAGAFAAAQASASNAPLVIAYTKTCDLTVGHCVGTAGNGGTIVMQVTSFRATGADAQLTLTEWITVGEISFTAEIHRAERHGDGRVVHGRRSPPAKRLRRRRPDSVEVVRSAATRAQNCVSRIREAVRTGLDAGPHRRVVSVS